MERQFNNGDFEKLLRDNANQYRMYPSDRVWKGIHSALHTRRRWYGLTAAIMFLITGSVVSIFIFNDKNVPNGVVEQNNAVNNVQDNGPSAREIKFSPQIRSTKPKNNKRETYFTESYLNSP
ncbi:MAG TPA: hypothetical protein VJ765_07110, partial [Chitinophagaceae bacterium]|nr:hypothetical protein [Chitinophagaceae bacterium]